MPADVVKIRVRLTTGKEFVNITCAVVEKLNYPLILGSDIVDKLNKQLIDCDVYVGGKVRVLEFMIFLTLQHNGSK